MSGGINLPRFTVTARQRPNVAVAAQGRPVVASVTVRGQQGAQGEAGDPGPQGEPGDYGSIRYDEVSGTPISLMPDVPAAFTLAAPVMMTNSLRGPFANFTFLSPDGRTLNARANGDSYLIRVRMSVVAVQAGGSFTTDLVIPGVSGGSSSRPRSLLIAAGPSAPVDELFQAFPGPNFVANGASIMLTSTVPATVTPQTLFVTPLIAI